MSGIFHRQLPEYADYHRDQRSCLMHIIGNPILFVAAVLPLSLLSVTVFQRRSPVGYSGAYPLDLMGHRSWPSNRRCGYPIAVNRHNHC